MAYQDLRRLVSRDQRKASDPRVSVWVDASAGSGKTKVLTDRLLRLLLQETPPEKILCLTFTRAAASEMQARVFQTLKSWCLGKDLQKLGDLLGPGASKDHHSRAQKLFYRLVDHPDRLKIMTVHSFCQGILQRFPLEAGTSPGFYLLDEGAREDMITQVLDERLKEGIEGTPLEVILDHMSFQRLQTYCIQGLKHSWMTGKELAEKMAVEATVGPFRVSSSLLSKVPLLKTGKTTDQRLAQVLQSYDLSQISFDVLCSCFLTTEAKVRSRLATKGVLEQDPTLEALLNEEAASILDHVRRLQAQQMVTLQDALHHVIHHIRQGYQKKKAQTLALDFDDLMTKTLALLRHPSLGPWVSFKMASGIDHILVDEAQDTSPEQWALIAHLCEDFFMGQGHRTMDPTLFVVGDFKQSIYGFQGAKPALFHGMRHFFQGKLAQVKRPLTQVAFDTSFRSRPEILSFVDDLFEKDQDPLMKRALSHYRVHTSIHDWGEGSIQLWPLVVEENDALASYVLADRLANFIAKSLNDGFGTSLGTQHVQPGDFLILVQRRQGFLYQMVRALKRRHVPVMGADRFTFQDDLIIKDFMAFWRFLLCPEDTFSLSTVLLSPLIGWPFHRLTHHLKEARQSNRKSGGLWAQLLQRTKAQEREDLERLKDWLAKADKMPMTALMMDVLAQQQEAIVARQGQEVTAVLDALMDTILTFEETKGSCIQHFVAWFEGQRNQFKRDVAQNPRNEVRLMTVHGSKGLQAPIVILPDTVHRPDTSCLHYLHEDQAVASHGDRHLHPYLMDLHKAHEAHCQEEYLRLLYVALTRAESHLILAGWQGKKEKAPKGSWYDLFQEKHPPVAADHGDRHTYRPLGLKSEEPPKEKPQGKKDIPAAFKEEKKKTLGASQKPELSVDFQGKSHDMTTHALERGRTIHRALEAYMLCGEVAPCIHDLLKRPGIVDLLAQGSPEVTLVGQIQGNPHAVRLDYLADLGDRIRIIDFKTDRHPPATMPDHYAKQLSVYQTLAQALFPNRPIETMILWTETGALMPLP